VRAIDIAEWKRHCIFLYDGRVPLHSFQAFSYDESSETCSMILSSLSRTVRRAAWLYGFWCWAGIAKVQDYPRPRMWSTVEFDLLWNRFLLLVIIDRLTVEERVEERIILSITNHMGTISDSTEADILDGFEFSANSLWILVVPTPRPTCDRIGLIYSCSILSFALMGVGLEERFRIGYSVIWRRINIGLIGPRDTPYTYSWYTLSTFTSKKIVSLYILTTLYYCIIFNIQKIYRVYLLCHCSLGFLTIKDRWYGIC